MAEDLNPGPLYFASFRVASVAVQVFDVGVGSAAKTGTTTRNKKKRTENNIKYLILNIFILLDSRFRGNDTRCFTSSAQSYWPRC